jgi:hypothetical protein
MRELLPGRRNLVVPCCSAKGRDTEHNIKQMRLKGQSHDISDLWFLFFVKQYLWFH